MTPAEWRSFYARERERLGAPGLDALLDRAAAFQGVRAPLVFPHTRLGPSGHLVAAAALAVLRAERVLALGVLHGARALGAPRGVHREDGPARDEFSLDNFRVLLARAAEREGVRAPEVTARFPFLDGGDVDTLPALDELRALVARDCAVVATADPVHHGVGYGTPEAHDPQGPGTRAFALGLIDAQLEALAARDLPAFRAAADRARSDFRDVGPVLAELLGAPRFAVAALELVDYADALGAPAPTWVAAPLMVGPQV